MKKNVQKTTFSDGACRRKNEGYQENNFSKQQ